MTINKSGQSHRQSRVDMQLSCPSTIAESGLPAPLNPRRLKVAGPARVLRAGTGNGRRRLLRGVFCNKDPGPWHAFCVVFRFVQDMLMQSFSHCGWRAEAPRCFR